MASLIHSASCKRFFQVELARKEGGEFGKPPRVDGGHGGGGGKRRDSAFGTSYSPTSKAFIGSNMLFFLNESNFEPLLFYKKRVHNFFMREGVR
jgi:hypothetical protein